MGAFFTNYHVRKGKKQKDAFINKLSGFICKRPGLAPCEKGESGESGSLTVYFPEKGEWVSFFSDLLDTQAETLSALSKMFGSDVLRATCNDSDFVTLDLVNGKKGIEAHVNSSGCEGYGCEPTTDFSGWENAVSDIEKFKADVAEERVFAEEFLDTLEGTMKLPQQQARMADYTLDGLDENSVVRLYFKTTDVTDEPVKLVIPRYDRMPCRFDSPINVVSACNDGRASKGIEVFFTGDYVENDEITFDDVWLEYGFDEHGGNRKRIPVELKKIKLKNGGFAYHWQDENFVIPASPNKSLPYTQWDKERFKREFLVRFTPRGNRRRVLDITVWLIPLENDDGGCCWYVWKGCGSKRGYIEEHNEHTISMCRPLTDEEKKKMLFDPNDFDLD